MSVDQLSNDDANSVDGEGVWAPEIEEAFQEGLKLHPPCGRRKHIIQEEGGGKMYGRNELIARHILHKTGKIRTRKQVSSHIQVLNRRKQKLDTQSTSASTSSETPSPSSGFSSITDNSSYTTTNNHLHHHHQLPQFSLHNNPVIPNQYNVDHLQTNNLMITQHSHNLNNNHLNHSSQFNEFYDFWDEGPIVTQKIRLVEFSAFIEYSNFATSTATNSTTAQSSTLISPLLGAVSLQDRLPQSNGQHSNSINSLTNDTTPQFNNGNNTYDSEAYQGSLSSSLNANNSNAIAPYTNGSNGIHQNNHNPDRFNIAHHQLLNGLNGSGIKRHSYVKIDYSQSIGRQTNKLETIDITQIQDKFPEIGDLYQRGHPYSFFLVKFWADINSDYQYNIEDQNTNFGLSSHFETVERFDDITVSTKACSYGCQVVEKIDKIYNKYNSLTQRYSYKSNNSPMCEFMIKFIKKLRQLPEISQMNSVLENFTVLQVITTDSTPEILMCLAYIFEVAPVQQNNGPQYHVYRLSKN